MPITFKFRAAQDAMQQAQLKQAEALRYIPTATAIPWDPVVSSTGTQPSITNGSGMYVRENHLIVAWAYLTLTVTSVGTGDYLISLPYELAAASDLASIGGGWDYHDASSGNEAHGFVFPNPGGVGAAGAKVKFGYWSAYPVGTRVNVGAATPWVPATGDMLHFWVIAQPANGA